MPPADLGILSKAISSASELKSIVGSFGPLRLPAFGMSARWLSGFVTFIAFGLLELDELFGCVGACPEPEPEPNLCTRDDA